jgi:hypothetical protein
MSRFINFHKSSISADFAIAGAEEKGIDYDQGNVVDKYYGAAYVFQRSGTIWNEVSILRLSDQTSEDAFGRSVSVTGNTAIVGSRGNSYNPGQISVFDQ